MKGRREKVERIETGIPLIDRIMVQKPFEMGEIMLETEMGEICEMRDKEERKEKGERRGKEEMEGMREMEEI